MLRRAKNNIFFLSALFCSIIVQSQDIDVADLNNYSKLEDLFYNYLDKGNKEKAAKIASLYLSKAKKEDLNTKKHIYGHLLFYQVSEFDDAISHLDTIIEIAKKFKSQKTYPGLAYFIKGGLYHEKKDFKNALDNYLIALEYAERGKRRYDVTLIKNNIGLIQIERIGKEREALRLFKECEKFYNSVDDKSKYSFDYLALLFSFSESYRKLGLIDSSSYYNKMGIKKSEEYHEKDFKEYFHFAEGINEYLRGNPSSALKALTESEDVLLKREDYTNLVELNYYLGSTYKMLDNNEKALYHFLKMDSLNNEHIDYSIQIRKGIEELIGYYKKENNFDKQLKYVKKLIRLDSIYINDYKAISHVMNTKYANRDLINEKNTLIQKLNISKAVSNKKNYILMGLSTVFLMMWFYFYKKQKSLLKKFDDVMNNVEDTPKKEIKVGENDKLDISDEIVNSILKSLEDFEKNNMYLKHDLNSQQLAKKLNTNTKYLSKVINMKKEKSIVNYINDLRVEYAIDKLKKDNKFRFYTISSIADEVGFSNPTSFSQSFYKKTNLKPSFFIKQLIKTSNS